VQCVCKGIGAMRMKITPEAVADLVFEACPSYREAWPEYDAGRPTDTIYSIPILIGFARHVAALWRRRQFSEFPAIFYLIERLHVEGNKKVVDHAVFYFTELLYIELEKQGINPRFADRRLGPVSFYWLDFLKLAFGWR
jgi:hypothetical protein